MSQKKDYIWNTIAGLVNAAEAVVMSMIVTRVTGLQDAGIITIGFAVGNTMMTIGKFGVRNYQVTDSKREYTFAEYLIIRIITIVLMMLAAVGYLGINATQKGYSADKIIAIAAIVFIYVVESLEDVIWGELQLEHRLASGAKIFILRWLGILLSFFLVILMRKNLQEALWAGAVVSVVVFGFAVKHYQPEKQKESICLRKLKRTRIVSLLKEVFPLFVVNFLIYYISNAPKYAIDGNMSDEVQACYGFVAMPVFVIALLNNIIYQPTLVHLSQQWNAGCYSEIWKRVKKQMLILLILTIVILVGAYILGIPVLSILYATDLTNYKPELLILLIGGSFLALCGYFGVILTTMRKQNYLMVGYILIAVSTIFVLNRCVLSGGTKGVSVGYAVLMCMLAILFCIEIYVSIRRKIKQKQDVIE